MELFGLRIDRIFFAICIFLVFVFIAVVFWRMTLLAIFSIGISYISDSNQTGPLIFILGTIVLFSAWVAEVRGEFSWRNLRRDIKNIGKKRF